MAPVRTAVCGRVCSPGGCRLFGRGCRGCYHLRPEVPAEPEAGMCPLYLCAALTRGLSHCGECALVPCGLWDECVDPNLSEPERETDRRIRLDRLALPLEGK